MIIGIDARPLAQKQLTGTAEYVRGLLGALIEIDDQNEYRLFFNSFAPVDFPDFPSKRVNVTGWRIPNKLFNLPLQKILKYPKIDQLLKADIFFQPNMGFVALSPGARKILTIHDLSFLRYPEFFSRRMIWWHRLADIRSQAKAAQAIIVPSYFTKGDVIELLGIPEEKISVVHFGLSPDFSVLDPRTEIAGFKAVKEKYGLPERFVLSLATHEPRKNISGLIRGFDRFVEESGQRGLSLVIAGASGWREEGIRRELGLARHPERIRLIGFIDQSEKKYLYNLAEVFAYISFYEGFGFPPLEALACGCPVIVANTASLPEVCGTTAVLADPIRLQTLLAALEKTLATRPSQAARIELSEKIKAEYSWLAAAKAHLDIFGQKK